jgi:N-acetylglucosamine malate deacetylase 1
MRFSDQISSVLESRKEHNIRPFLLGIEFRRYKRFIRSSMRAVTAKVSPRPSVVPFEKVAKILVLAPHPDDEVLGCGGTIRQHTRSGSQAKVLYLTDGSHGNRAIEQNLLIEMRHKEAKTGLNILGCDDLVFFDLKDSELKANGNTIEKVVELIEAYRPEIIFVPFFLDSHPDHVESAVIAAYALRKYKGPMMCYFYEVWTALMPNILIDISDEMDEKIHALEAHWSQVSHLNLRSSMIGLNSYRSVGLGDGIRYCEAFYRCPKEEFIKIVLKQ